MNAVFHELNLAQPQQQKSLVIPLISVSIALFFPSSRSLFLTLLLPHIKSKNIK